MKALSIIKYKKDLTQLPEKWEPLLNNIGHVLRKLKRFEEALEFHKQAMVLSPQNASTYSAIGFVYSLMAKWHDAVEFFHKVQEYKCCSWQSDWFFVGTRPETRRSILVEHACTRHRSSHQRNHSRNQRSGASGLRRPNVHERVHADQRHSARSQRDGRRTNRRRCWSRGEQQHGDRDGYEYWIKITGRPRPAPRLPVQCRSPIEICLLGCL